MAVLAVARRHASPPRDDDAAIANGGEGEGELLIAAGLLVALWHLF